MVDDGVRRVVADEDDVVPGIHEPGAADEEPVGLLNRIDSRPRDEVVPLRNRRQQPPHLGPHGVLSDLLRVHQEDDQRFVRLNFSDVADHRDGVARSRVGGARIEHRCVARVGELRVARIGFCVL